MAFAFAGAVVLFRYPRPYAVLSESQWLGYRPPPEQPAVPGWMRVGGNPAHMPSALAQAALEGDLAGKVHMCWPATPRTAWRSPWRGSGGRS
jgi:hypothetical protein